MSRISPCLDYAKETSARRADRILGVLSGPGAFTEMWEWRISTYVKQGIERFDPDSQPGRFHCWSGTDGLWEAWVNGEREALTALELLSQLQMSFFYTLGWPSWPSKGSLDADTAPNWEPQPGRNECESYIALLWQETRSARERHRGAVVDGISAAGTWDSEELALVAQINVEASAPGLQLSTNCPTPLRALDVGLVYRQIAVDVSQALSLSNY